MADFESGVPERGNEVPEPALDVVHECFGHEHHDLDVRVRVQFAAAVAADRNQGEFPGGVVYVLVPQVADDLVHELCPEPHEQGHRVAVEEAPGELFVGQRQGIAAGLFLQTDR